MKNTLTLSLPKESKGTLILDIVALVIVALVPTFSHLLSFPLYYTEPMRIMVILALLHTSRRNAYVLSVVLPLVSVLISGHPLVLKSLLIIMELVLNVWFFTLFAQYLRSKSLSMAFSIVISKTVYYLLKALFITAGLFSASIFATPLLIQLILTLSLTGYTLFITQRIRQ